ncbi:hypothetical protein EDD22DRAFT_851040 [Suillus occidentalis]|nr:hypothetical protein EDD22DRAFT_851040 [Suillus occidentalis]
MTKARVHQKPIMMKEEVEVTSPTLRVPTVMVCSSTKSPMLVKVNALSIVWTRHWAVLAWCDFKAGEPSHVVNSLSMQGSTSVAVIVRVTVVQDITREESITLDYRSLFTTSHGIMHVPWLMRMAMKRLMSVTEGIMWVMMGGILNVIEDLITRLAEIVKRTTLMKVIMGIAKRTPLPLVKVITRVRDDLLMMFLLVAMWRVVGVMRVMNSIVKTLNGFGDVREFLLLVHWLSIMCYFSQAFL